jgi:hypothetical protein
VKSFLRLVMDMLPSGQLNPLGQRWDASTRARGRRAKQVWVASRLCQAQAPSTVGTVAPIITPGRPLRCSLATDVPW